MSDLHGRGSGAVNFAVGAITEMAKQGGSNMGQISQVGGFSNRMGHQAVKQAVKVAPQTVAALGGVVAVAAPIAAPLIVAGAVGYGAYRVIKWLAD